MNYPSATYSPVSPSATYSALINNGLQAKAAAAASAATGDVSGIGDTELSTVWIRHTGPLKVAAGVSVFVPTGKFSLASDTALRANPGFGDFYTIRPGVAFTYNLNPSQAHQDWDAGVTVAASLSPQRTAELHKAVIDAGVDIFVIRGTTVSAEHVGNDESALNLKKFIYELDVPVIVGGVATATGALHLMRAGAAGVLVGFGGGAAHTTRKVLGIEVPMASAVAEVAAARREYLDESGGRYVHVIADGSVGRSGDIAKAIACGADAVMMGSPLAKAVEAPGLGWHWGSEAHHQELPRGERVNVGTVGSIEEILLGPSHTSDGSMNLFGALRRAMATSGYSDVKAFQRVEVIIHGA